MSPLTKASSPSKSWRCYLTCFLDALDLICSTWPDPTDVFNQEALKCYAGLSSLGYLSHPPCSSSSSCAPINSGLFLFIHLLKLMHSHTVPQYWGNYMEPSSLYGIWYQDPMAQDLRPKWPLSQEKVSNWDLTKISFSQINYSSIETTSSISNKLQSLLPHWQLWNNNRRPISSLDAWPISLPWWNRGS